MGSPASTALITALCCGGWGCYFFAEKVKKFLENMKKVVDKPPKRWYIIITERENIKAGGTKK